MNFGNISFKLSTISFIYLCNIFIIYYLDNIVGMPTFSILFYFFLAF